MNITISGESIDDFARLVYALNERRFLWSCLCDKHGDWRISCDDDVTADQIKPLITDLKMSVDIEQWGEMLFMLDEVAPMPKGVEGEFVDGMPHHLSNLEIIANLGL